MRRATERVFDRVVCELVDILDDAGIAEDRANTLAERITRRVWRLAGRIHSAATREAIGRGVRLSQSRRDKPLPREIFSKFEVKDEI